MVGEVYHRRDVARPDSKVYSADARPVVVLKTRKRCLSMARTMNAKRLPSGEKEERIWGALIWDGCEIVDVEAGLPLGGFARALDDFFVEDSIEKKKE